MESDDEPITLSAHALAALSEFKQEEKQRIDRFESLKKASEDRFDEQQGQKAHQQAIAISIDDFQEDWQLSQFWYSDETAEILGKALLEGADANTVVVIASAPSVYAAIKRFPPEEIPTKHIYVLEYDKRFAVLGGDNFSFYDYNEPNNIPIHLKNKCHRLLIDPPFLEEECQTKSAQAARNLLIKDCKENPQFRLISSTGERMRDVVKKNYPETKLTTFYPEHKNGLSNEFRCYASFESPYWKFEQN
ncbi:putative N6-adenine methyltransferase-domain-containing protein [Scheffersomyces amazonensis]|uniref:putative N6-adenine methyltransferase-domain-containing protein n=1 Tax=Scheffersomyces amazonensis TaxID=1078765 RepID=UPI00315D5ADE